MVHDSYLCTSFKNVKPWPTKRVGNCYVGSPIECGEGEIFYPCPLQCRPNESDWLYC